MNIQDTDISNRAKNVCEVLKITTLEDLAKMCEDTLKKARQCGSKTTNELKQLLWKNNMRFSINPITKHRKPLDYVQYELEKINSRLSAIEKHLGIHS
jgi:DNA-directed RNA polymerase alpha subunit